MNLDDFFPILILILKWYLYYCGHTTPHHVKPIFLQGGFSGELEVNYASISYVFFPSKTSHTVANFVICNGKLVIYLLSYQPPFTVAEVTSLIKKRQYEFRLNNKALEILLGWI